MNISSYLARRIIQMLIVVIGVTIVVFFLIHLVPGNPAEIYLGNKATPAKIAALDHQWHLDQPLPQQYVAFMTGLLHGSLGNSLLYSSPASTVIFSRLPATLWLVIYATVLTVIITIPLAIISALRKDRPIDHGVRVSSLAALGMPSFWVGIVLILILGIRFRVFPVAGSGSGLVGHLYYLFLPALTLAISLTPLLVRSLRASMIEVLGSDYIVTANAKGISKGRIVLRHLLPNSVLPTLSLLGVNVAFLIGGTVVIEQIFGINGIGNLMVNAILGRDFFIVQGVTLVFALGVVLVNFLTDIGYMLLDPRVRAGQ